MWLVQKVLVKEVFGNASSIAVVHHFVLALTDVVGDGIREHLKACVRSSLRTDKPDGPTF